jgi:hypothetical protein
VLSFLYEKQRKVESLQARAAKATPAMERTAA